MQISGEIVIDAESDSFANATAFVYLEDVSRADDAARLLGRAKLTAVVHHQGAESRVPFAVEAIDAPHGGDAALRVHISRHLITRRSRAGPWKFPSNPSDGNLVDKKITGAVSGARYRKQYSAKPRLSGIRRT